MTVQHTIQSQAPRAAIVAVQHGETMTRGAGFEALSFIHRQLDGLMDPLIMVDHFTMFPATAAAPKSNTGYATSGFERRCWKRSDSVRKIVRSALEAAGLPNYGPHAFRHMLARRAARTSNSVAELIAISQNLGHTDVLTTLRSYGQIDRDRQRQLVTGRIDEE